VNQILNEYVKPDNMPLSVNEVRVKIRNVFSSDGIGEAIKQLKVLVYPEGRAYNSILQLEQELKEINLRRVSGSVDQRGLDLKYGEISERLLTLLDTLDESDLGPPQKGKKSKQGSLLYQIPTAMAVQKETRCRVRIAYDLYSVLENIELTEDTHIKEVRISEVMEVILIDPSHEAAFIIRTLNKSQEQFVEKNECTEWIFSVKPLRQGHFPLLLRISVVEKIGDKERTRDIVLEEMVVIVAEVKTTTEPNFRETGLIVWGTTTPSGDLAISSSAVEERTTMRKRSPLMKRTFSGALALATLMTVSGIAYAMLPAVRMNIDWTFTSLRNTQEAYQEFAEKYAGKPRAEQALVKVEELDWRAVVEEKSIPDIERFLMEHPQGLFEEKATELLETLYFEKLVTKASPESSVISIENFIKRFPEGKLVKKAERKLRQIKKERKDKGNKDSLSPYPRSKSQLSYESRAAAAWARAIAANTPKVFSEYLRLFPDGAEAGEARKRLARYASARERADWDEALRANTIEAFADHKRRYPSGAYTGEADTRIAALLEAADYEAAISQNTVAAYRSYLEKYPEGARAGDARSRMNGLQAAEEEAQAWRTARTENTPAAYRRYLEAWPDGRHADEATQLLAEASRDDDVVDQIEANMVPVSGGTFWMGCSARDDGDCLDMPSYTVSDFYIGKYEVTQKEWREVMGNSPSYFKNCNNCPVEQVSYEDIQIFLKKLNAKTGKRYRLPTEAEWEYAARGGSESWGYEYSGSNNLDEVAWYQDNSASKTHPVGQKKSNELGLYDMSGNVKEWCQYERGDDGVRYRVQRGGSCLNNALGCVITELRTEELSEYVEPNRNYALGFRLALFSGNR
jgi:formylglycine-generating enzyme required for sulfatase activity/outer membrane protein assembly factor BamD (BamD/ComL family)